MKDSLVWRRAFSQRQKRHVIMRMFEQTSVNSSFCLGFQPPDHQHTHQTCSPRCQAGWCSLHVWCRDFGNVDILHVVVLRLGPFVLHLSDWLTCVLLRWGTPSESHLMWATSCWNHSGRHQAIHLYTPWILYKNSMRFISPHHGSRSHCRQRPEALHHCFFDWS